MSLLASFHSHYFGRLIPVEEQDMVCVPFRNKVMYEYSYVNRHNAKFRLYGLDVIHALRPDSDTNEDSSDHDTHGRVSHDEASAGRCATSLRNYFRPPTLRPSTLSPCPNWCPSSEPRVMCVTQICF